MGNVMIQPTMYFQLKNVPLFEGAYWIIEVTHNITNNTVSTSFKGVRIPKDSLPDPKESFTAMYRVLFDKIMNAATARGSVALTTTTEEIVRGGFVTDRGPEDYRIPGEELIDESVSEPIKTKPPPVSAKNWCSKRLTLVIFNVSHTI